MRGEPLTNQSKAVKVFVDKWFVNKGCGSGRAPTGEIVVIHASAVHGAEFFFIRTSGVQGAELLTIGTDALVQVENDDGRAQEAAERDKEREKTAANEMRRAAALTAELAAPSEEKVSVVCDHTPGLR